MVSWFSLMFHVSWVVAAFFCTPFVCIVHVRWTGTVAPAGVGPCAACDRHMSVAWLSSQLICSEKRALQNASWTSMRLHRSNTAVCWNWGNVLRFGRKNRNQRLWKSLSLRTSSLRTLSSFERRWTCWRRERFVWRDVVPAGTREVRLVFVWNLCVTPTFWVFFGDFDVLSNVYLSSKPPKRYIPEWISVVWGIDRVNPSTRFCCRRRQEKRKGDERYTTL